MTELAIRDSSELVARIETARALLDAGDVERALKLSSVAYDQAKAVAGSAERVKTSRDLVDKARRMQAEALKIESLCYVAMADAVDDAQAKGELSRGGRPKTVSSENSFTLDEIGVDRQQLHAARSLRSAIEAEPGFVDRVVEVRLLEGLEPSRAALKNAARHAIGTKTATKEDRGDDLYETPIEAMRTLLALESFGLNVLEPSVGRGAISRPLEDAGYEVTISDLVDRGITTRHGECQGVGDFLTSIAVDGGWDIVTNPPYGVANAYAAHALREHRPRKMALLLNLNFQCGYEDADRRFVMDENPPSRIYAFAHRLPMMHRDGWEGNKASSQMNTGWFVWERNEDGTYGDGHPRLIRVVYDNFEHSEPLTPGAGGNVSPLRFDAPDEEFARTTPRKTLEERCDEETARALVWMAESPGFDAGQLRRGIGVRPSVADALIADLATKGLIWAGNDDDGWRISTAGMTALNATAAVLLGATLDEVAA
ncbi:hypothetical protein IFT59_18710 [Rhizobium sp. CFBP 8752]|uniref:hypothetical protein n=1 Tax=Rhizobium sp. CFBP 8752 TaxID=2775301 RepID=UPI00177F9DC6|nr:hypothetical protein [Rhizobium sp. CFBP 8752]MBD8665276.1 hypothetical protein [Rhizobium sp. CFBP 8752]